MHRSRNPFNPTLADIDLILCDVTLREGEQTPGVTFSHQERRELLTKLAQAGVDQAQIAFPAGSDVALAESADLCAMDLPIDIELMSNGMREDWKWELDQVLACGPDVVHSSFFVSPYVHSGWNAQMLSQVKTRIGDVVDYAHGAGMPVNISFIDASRAAPEDLLALTQRAVEAGAERVRVPDTAGASTPEGTYEMVSRCVELANSGTTRIGVHCHNDFGLALANTLAGIRAGASLVDVSVNGLGDRCGNASLAEVVGALNILLAFPTRVDLASMTALSKFTDQISQITTSSRAPLVGDHAFSHEIDVHVAEVLREPLAFQSMTAEHSGNETRIIFGTKSGPSALTFMERKFDFTIPSAHRTQLLEAIHDIATKRPGHVLGEADFWEALESLPADFTAVPHIS